MFFFLKKRHCFFPLLWRLALCLLSPTEYRTNHPKWEQFLIRAILIYLVLFFQQRLGQSKPLRAVHVEKGGGGGGGGRSSVRRARDFWSRSRGFDTGTRLGRCQKSWSPRSVSVWQNVKFSDGSLGSRLRHSRVAREDVKKSTKTKTTKKKKTKLIGRPICLEFHHIS